jgi:hypothetical protein
MYVLHYLILESTHSFELRSPFYGRNTEIGLELADQAVFHLVPTATGGS